MHTALQALGGRAGAHVTHGRLSLHVGKPFTCVHSDTRVWLLEPGLWEQTAWFPGGGHRALPRWSCPLCVGGLCESRTAAAGP